MALGSVTVFRNFREKTSVRVAARDVTNIMRLARRRAVIEREDYLAVYDLGNEKVWVQSESSYSSYGIRPDSGTEQLLPDMAIIARVTAGSGGLATGTGDPAIEIDDYSSNPIGYHKFSPKSTVDDYTESPYSIEPSVWLKDERRVNFYKVTLTPQTARAKIYSEW